MFDSIPIAAMLAAAVIALRFASLNDVSKIGCDEPNKKNSIIDIDALESRIQQVAGWIPSATCLPQSIVARAILGWHGIHADIVIGFRRSECWEGHAWVEAPNHTLFLNPYDMFRETIRL